MKKMSATSYKLDSSDPHARLLAASYRGRTDVLQPLMGNVDVNHGGGHPLCLACRGCQYDVAQMLLRHGARPTGVALCIACGSGYTQLVRLLLDSGAPMDNDAIYWACRGGHECTARLLLDRGADATYDAVCAATNGNLTRMMLDRGGEVGERALRCAAIMGRADVVELLLERGAPVCGAEDAAEHGHDSALGVLLRYGAKPALRRAVRCGHVSTAKMLIDNGAQPSGVIYAVANGHVRMVQMLLLHGAELPEGAMFLAVKCGQRGMAKFLGGDDEDVATRSVRYHSEITMQDETHGSLYRAVMIGDYDGARALLCRGHSADMQLVDLALDCGHTRIAWLLLCARKKD